ncbi:hypothetical protein SAMN05421823_111180 [Catalinimonas alkaloidigena]|uniref:Uncharacterized protein n=1 Tax=Catalinimonas alkaloidigena TaxID=1075417 RepID=A0A1G9RJE7_9BACT|nr:hypothetical protein [Catalinimonas alkaloidigena]SDM23449.1 hypothetical protein SAMN05421823_111180 [Catalinimonas alkaloidigena]
MKATSLFSVCFLVLCGLLCRCTSPAGEDWQRLEQEGWKSDRLGCAGNRQKLEPLFEDLRTELIGMAEREVRQRLGPPDRQELEARSQKFYIYYLTSGSQCAGQTGREGKLARIRFSALNQVSEVSYDHLAPSADQPQK